MVKFYVALNYRKHHIIMYLHEHLYIFFLFENVLRILWIFSFGYPYIFKLDLTKLKFVVDYHTFPARVLIIIIFS